MLPTDNNSGHLRDIRHAGLITGIPPWLFDFDDMAVKTYLALRSFERVPGKGCFPKVETIATMVGRKKRQTQDYIKTLREAGAIIVVSRGNHKSSQYFFPENLQVARGAGYCTPKSGVQDIAHEGTTTKELLEEVSEEVLEEISEEVPLEVMGPRFARSPGFAGHSPDSASDSGGFPGNSLGIHGRPRENIFNDSAKESWRQKMIFVHSTGPLPASPNTELASLRRQLEKHK